MPNIPSAIKRLRSNKRKNEQNQVVLSELKTLNKKLRKATDSAEETKRLAQLLIKRYDQAVSKGIVPKGRADRKKSRIAKFISKPKQSA